MTAMDIGVLHLISRLYSKLRRDGFPATLGAVMAHGREAIRAEYWLRRGHRTLHIPGMRIELLTRTREEASISKFNERELLTDFVGELREDDVLYDVGANIGVYSIAGSNEIESGSIVAFEPLPANAELLRDNVAFNDADVTTDERALTDCEGEIMLEANSEIDSAASITDQPGGGVDVSTVPGDQVTGTEHPAPTVIKVDVEGAEGLVVRGLRDTLTKHCRLLYLEVHKGRFHLQDHGVSETELREMLLDAGFDIEEMAIHSGPNTHLKCTKS